MSRTTRVGLLAGASVLTLTGVSVADGTTEANNQEARIASLEAQIAQLKGEGQVNEQRAAEVRGMIQDVLADADTRASLLSQGMTSGYDGGFVIGSADGNFKLKINGQSQIRFVWNDRDTSGDSDEDSTFGFENRNTKVGFSGHIADPSWQYQIRGVFDASGGAFDLDYAYVKKSMDNGMYVQAGQFKSPFLAEYLIAETKQLTVNRSLVSEEYNTGYSQGVALGWASDNFRGQVMFTDGADSANTDWTDADHQYALAGRVEFLVAGNWKQFDDMTSWRGSEYGCKIGAALYTDGDGDGAADGDDTNTSGVTVDVGVEGDGWNVFGAFVYWNYDDDAAIDTDEMAFVIQGGYFFTDEIEAFARYEYGDPDSDVIEDLNVITAGINYYFAKHNMKWTTDLGFAMDPIGSKYASTGAGYAEDEAENDGQFVFRTQLQLAF